MIISSNDECFLFAFLSWLILKSHLSVFTPWSRSEGPFSPSSSHKAFLKIQNRFKSSMMLTTQSFCSWVFPYFVCQSRDMCVCELLDII